MNLVHRLEEIRRLQGLPPMPDPTQTQGPIPHFEPPTVTDQDPFEDFPREDPAYPDPQKSPLVAAAQPKPEGVAAGLFSKPETAREFMARNPDSLRLALEAAGAGHDVMIRAVMAGSELAVLDSEASYGFGAGHKVVLSDSERQAVARIVLGALQRVVREQLASLPTPEPKRRRRSRTEPQESIPAAPKKRGRPRKNP